MNDLFGNPDADDDDAFDHTARAETYRSVTGVFRHLTRDSLLVDAPAAFRGRTVWIARSLIHGADDGALGTLTPGQEFTFRLMAWKAAEVGWP